MEASSLIIGKLDSKALEKAIDDIVAKIDGGMYKAASSFDTGLELMQGALNTFSRNAKTTVKEISDSFKQLGTTFDEFAKAMEKSSKGSSRTSGGGRSSVTPNFLPNTRPNALLGELEAAKKEAEQLRKKFEESGDEIKIANRQIDDLKRRIKSAKTTPMTLNEVIGMPMGTLDEISSKLRAFKLVSINTKDKEEIKQFREEYKKVKDAQKKLIGSNGLLASSNNALARSFGYIRNRLVYALTIGALANFTKQVVNVRAEYELLERSLGILISDMDRGSELFNELNAMAIKSPFTLTELATGAKQLLAYNFAEDEVVETTRRLADISAALGVPMERLVYNLGQIRAQTVLNARDARDFANAGFAIVPMLAEMYTKQKKFGDEVVTTSKVYDMMSKKMVSYGDVMKVINGITDEGGKFFDYQAKQAETLKVQLMNLKLAFNNMANDIGKSTQGTMTFFVRSIKYLYENWREVYRIIGSALTAFLTFKAVVKFNSMLRGFALFYDGWVKLSRSIRNATSAMQIFNAVTKTNVIGAVLSVIAGAIGYFALFKESTKEASQEVVLFGENAAKTIGNIEGLKLILKGTKEGTNTYKKALSELKTITEEYGITLDTEKATRTEINNTIATTIELIKKEAAERQRANMIRQAGETYETSIKNARDQLNEDLKDAATPYEKSGFAPKKSDVVQKNADALTSIIEDIVTTNADKDAKTIEKLINQRFSGIKIKLDASTLVSKGGEGIIAKYIQAIFNANNELERANNLIEKNNKLAKENNTDTLTSIQRNKAFQNQLQNSAHDANALYRQIKSIVDVTSKNYSLNIDFKMAKENIPEWMKGFSIEKVRANAIAFGAAVKNNQKVKGYTLEQTMIRAIQYASLLAELEEKASRGNGNNNNTNKTKKDVLGEAFEKEINIISNIQKKYKEYRDIGVSAIDALQKASSEYNKTLEKQNATLSKFGVETLSGNKLATMTMQEIRDFYQQQLTMAEALKNSKGVEALEKAIASLNTEITKVDYKKIAEGLNNDLAKLKDEYELGVQLSTDTGLGDMMLDLFDIDPNQLPQSIDDYAQRVVDRLNKDFKERKVNLELPTLDLTKDDLGAFKKQFESGVLDKTSYDEIVKYSEAIRALRKKDAEETYKEAQDLQYKLADVNGKIAINNAKLADLDLKIAKETDAQKKKLLKLQREDLQRQNDDLQSSILQLLPAYQRVFGEFADYSARVARKHAQDLLDILEKAQNGGQDANKRYTITGPNIKKPIKVSQKELGRAIDKVNKKLQESAKWSEKVKEAFKKGKDGVVDWGEGVSLLAEGFQRIMQSVNSIKDTFATIGVSFSKDVNEAISNLNQAGEGLSEMAQGAMSGNAMQVISGGLKSFVGIGKTLSGVFGGNMKDYYTDTKDALEKFLEVLSKVQKYQMETLEKSSGMQAMKKYQQIIDYNNEAIQKYRDLAEAAGRSGSSLGSHSYAYRTNKNLKDEWGKISKIAGTTVDSIQDMYELSGKQLRAIMENIGPKVWEKIDSKIREGLEGIIEYSEKAEEAAEQLGIALTDVSFDDVTKDFKSMLQDWESTSETFSEKFEEYMRNAIVRSMMIGKYMPMLEKWYIHFQERMDDGKLNLQEVQPLRDEYMNIANMALQERNSLAQVMGISTKKEQELSNLQQGIQGVTETTANALEAYLNGISQQTYLHGEILMQIRDTLKNFDIDAQTSIQSQMLLQLQNSYQIQMAIRDILQGCLSPIGNAFNVQLTN